MSLHKSSSTQTPPKSIELRGTITHKADRAKLIRYSTPRLGGKLLPPYGRAAVCFVHKLLLAPRCAWRTRSPPFSSRPAYPSSSYVLPPAYKSKRRCLIWNGFRSARMASEAATEAGCKREKTTIYCYCYGRIYVLWYTVHYWMFIYLLGHSLGCRIFQFGHCAIVSNFVNGSATHKHARSPSPRTPNLLKTFWPDILPTYRIIISKMSMGKIRQTCIS